VERMVLTVQENCFVSPSGFHSPIKGSTGGVELVPVLVIVRRENGADNLKLMRGVKRTDTLMRCGLALYLLKQKVEHWSYEVRHCTLDRWRGLVELCVELYQSGKWGQETSVDVQDLVHSYFRMCCLCGIL